MAEYPFETTKRIATIFAGDYNKIHGTRFLWDDTKSYQPEKYYDFQLYDSTDTLIVQLVSANSNPAYEIGTFRYARTVANRAKEILESRGLPGMYLHLNFVEAPTTKRDADILAHLIVAFVSHKVATWHGQSVYFSYDYLTDNQYIADFQKYLKEIEFGPLEREAGVTTSIMCGTATTIDDVQRVVRAAQNKEEKYLARFGKQVFNQLILLVDSGTFPFTIDSIPEIQSQLESSLFKSIWLVNDFLVDSSAIRIKEDFGL